VTVLLGPESPLSLAGCGTAMAMGSEAEAEAGVDVVVVVLEDVVVDVAFAAFSV
jgi:hypothetical protein